MGTKKKRGELDNGRAFLPDPRETGRVRSSDSLAELVGEGFVTSATLGEDVYEQQANEVTDDELGGPFIETDATEEFASSTDPSNPEDATKEPFPTAIRPFPQ